jgi:hypothetical protein
MDGQSCGGEAGETHEHWAAENSVPTAINAK